VSLRIVIFSWDIGCYFRELWKESMLKKFTQFRWKTSKLVQPPQSTKNIKIAQSTPKTLAEKIASGWKFIKEQETSYNFVNKKTRGKIALKFYKFQGN
jgi:hypothetical protein